MVENRELGYWCIDKGNKLVVLNEHLWLIQQGNETLEKNDMFYELVTFFL